MAKLEYANCEILLVDRDLNTRQSVKNILHDAGFRELVLGKTLADVHAHMSKSMPDLLIGSCELPDGDFIDYVKEVRRGKAGNNPFIPIIMLVEEPTPQLVSRIVESGTDTVIAKPISTAQMLDRVGDLIEARKKFVVSDHSTSGRFVARTELFRGSTHPTRLRPRRMANSSASPKSST